MGHVIGKKGRHIESLRQGVAFAQLDETNRGGQLELVGAAHDVQNAAEKAVRNIGKAWTPKLHWKCEVPKRLVGRVIGKGGSHIEDVNSIAGARATIRTIDPLTSSLEISAASEAAMRRAVELCEDYAGERLHFHGKGGKIDRVLDSVSGKSAKPKSKPRDGRDFDFDLFEWSNCELQDSALWAAEDEYPPWDNLLQDFLQDDDDSFGDHNWRDLKGLATEMQFVYRASAIPKQLMGRLIGPRGSNLDKIREVVYDLNLTDRGILELVAESEQSMDTAIELVVQITRASLIFSETANPIIEQQAIGSDLKFFASKNGLVYKSTTVPQRAIGRIIGRQGTRIEQLKSLPGVRDCRLDDGVLELAADDNESMDNAVALACDFADMDLFGRMGSAVRENSGHNPPSLMDFPTLSRKNKR